MEAVKYSLLDFINTKIEKYNERCSVLEEVVVHVDTDKLDQVIGKQLWVERIELKRWKQRRQYVNSIRFDPFKSDVELAKEYILKSGKLNIDGIEDHALIEKANEIRLSELLSKKLKTGYIHFNGKYCDDDKCRGWNGNDKRCECGKHPVRWLDSTAYFLDTEREFVAIAY